MFTDTAGRLDRWESEVIRLQDMLNNLDEDQIANGEDEDIIIDLEYAKSQVGYAWQDDELEEMEII